ncbi:uncharacterized protein LOC131676603 [Topomyia yanbarensis]|uniref:uncharacterized protein LOC131676603 n=1 Tax=Topomyia yanbarensis TaxID=2498891 RepID=UPI00273BB3C7|nr:uncharacterized protein LOC131676603 [Topomyia yanbarensis]
MKLTLFVVLCGLATVLAVPMTELATRSEEFRLLFDALHTEKDEFVKLTRTLTRAELKMLNEASQKLLAQMWNDVEHFFDDTRALIAEFILYPNAVEDCLLGLTEEIVAERIRAAGEMSSCAAYKINIKESLADEFRQLGNVLQRISTAAAEYTLFTFASHNSFIDSAGHLRWLEENYENQRVFWETTARTEAQADLDALEVNRPALIQEFTACLNVIRDQMTVVDRNINQRLPRCLND